MTAQGNNTLKIKFGKVFWPALIAVITSSILGWILFFIILGGVTASSGESDADTVKSKTVLHLTLSNEVSEVSSSSMNPTSFQLDKKTGLASLLAGFKSAATDSDIEGIFIEIDDLSCGYGNAREIRNAINQFEKSGKWVIAYHRGELIGLKEYYIASAANKNFGFPSSTMEFLGLGTEYMFFKGMLDKLEVEAQVIRGKNNDFKSAVEPYFLDRMSDSSKMQVQRYLTSLWFDIRQDIGKDRKIDIAQLNAIAENQWVRKAGDAVKFGLLDGTGYRDEIETKIKKLLKIKSTVAVNYFSFEKYANKAFKADRRNDFSASNIAVVMAEGEIATDGDGMSSEKVCKYLKEARENKNIKIIVLRVNSPGGSALASDEIWREVKLANQSKKVIVSMGDVAASGGYYIAAPATRIFAQKTTITGSIGVFGVIPFTGNMLQNKLGLTFDRVGTNSSSIMTLNKKLTPKEFGIIQEEVDGIYTQFLGIVASGRKMTIEQVNRVARGRVWTGVDALSIGLVDEIGGLQDAIMYAKKIAKIKKAKVRYWPANDESQLELFLNQVMEDEETSLHMKDNKMTQEFIQYYEIANKLGSRTGILMRLPFDLKID
jgi:protease-4